MKFRGQVEDCFLLVEKGLAVMLNRIEGMPKTGMRVCIGETETRIIDVGRNSTDGQPVSTRDCLTGRTCSPYGFILIDFLEQRPKRGVWVEEARDNDHV
ncbi:hypothetical protein PVW46_08630 [Mameliella sp. AT18]|uniref:hypothetical protein n=1 Tax=Mameliella sp. AT18 TaxID=3028385 RepID=UPI000841062D|nr:hypothetical protein [Mameliella sp. AT18]MDD9729972.1 hypothetical protein [Mameliella sp. AT18]ODM45371.1 hypothetical protein A9320_10050 [Ruegeria sp. PBVC088]